MRTATGAVAAAPVPLPGPAPLQALAANTDERGPVEILVSDNRTVLLYVVTDCSIEPVRDVDGSTFVLDLGFREIGTGVGCVDVDLDGTRELVSVRQDTAAPRVEWTRTVIELEGTEAQLGAADGGVFHEPRDHRSIALLSTVSCGAFLIDEGVTEPRPAPVG